MDPLAKLSFGADREVLQMYLYEFGKNNFSECTWGKILIIPFNVCMTPNQLNFNLNPLLTDLSIHQIDFSISPF
jgi:hypothetical protein